MGFRFRLQGKDLPCRPDLVFASRKKAIFVHGCFWHGHTCRRGKAPSSNVLFWANKIHNNRERDARNLKALRAIDWSTLVVWECELRDAAKTRKVLRQFLSD
jgi:DNA mismatch endonuclease (patch repair protein)